jgi:GTP cyclohydrolase I
MHVVKLQPLPSREPTMVTQEKTSTLPLERKTESNLETAVRSILTAVGEETDRDGLIDTPRRVARMYEELLSGYHTDPITLLNNALFDAEYDEMVVVRGIEFHSLCEHHILPFTGEVSVGYLPGAKIVGLSKIPRIVDMFARRLQVQERLTKQIAETINMLVQPRGVAVVVNGLHMCSVMRGVKKQNSEMVTSSMLGEFKINSATRNEFLSHIRQ